MPSVRYASCLQERVMTHVGTEGRDSRVCMWWYGSETLCEKHFAFAGTCGSGCAGIKDEDLAVSTWWCGSEVLSLSEACFVSEGIRILPVPVSEKGTCRCVRSGGAARQSDPGQHVLCSGENVRLGVLASEGTCMYACTWWYGSETLT